MFLDLSKNLQLLLKDVSVNANLLECFGRVDVEQTYENNTKELLEVVYIFPLATGDSLTGFSICIDGKRTLIGVLKEKQKAKKEYTDAVENKQVAVYLEKQHDGTHKVNVGNIEPGTQIVIKFTYITQLESQQGKYVFVLPTNIAPKYQLKHPSHYSYNSHQPKYDTKKENFFKVNVNVTWESYGRIEKVESFTHNNSLTVTSSTDLKRSVSVETSPLDGDFNLAMTTHMEAYPILYKLKDEDLTYYMCVHKLIEKDVMFQQESEYIFLVDRSGSMDGEKITKTCEALELFLRSLPAEKSYFNIVSFGTEYEYLYKQCVTYNDSNLKDALMKVKEFGADMGGTELENVIKNLLNNKTERRRCYFLLTDGQVSCVDGIANNIAKDKKPEDRFFTLGIGQDAERHLIEEVARVGCGSYRMDVDTRGLNEAVVQLLDDSSKEYFYNVHLSLVNNDGQSREVQDVLNKESFILPNKEFICRFEVKNAEDTELKELRMTADRASSKNNQDNVQLVINLKGPVTENEFLKQLYARDLLKVMERSGADKTEITQVSLKFNVLSKCTAFLVVDEKQVVAKELDTKVFEVPHYSRHLRQEYLMIDEISTSNESCKSSKSSKAYSMRPQRAQMSQKSITQAISDEDMDECVEGSFDSGIVLEKKKKKKNLSSGLAKIGSSLRSASHSFMGMFKKSKSKTEKTSDDNDNNTDQSEHKVIEFQNMDGSFNICDALLNLLGVTVEQVKKVAAGLSIDENIAAYVFLIRYFKSRNEPSEKLILKKLTTFVLNLMNNSSETLDNCEKFVVSFHTKFNNVDTDSDETDEMETEEKEEKLN